MYQSLWDFSSEFSENVQNNLGKLKSFSKIDVSANKLTLEWEFYSSPSSLPVSSVFKMDKV